MKSQSRLESAVADFFAYLLRGSKSAVCCYLSAGRPHGAALVFLLLMQATAANLFSYNETTSSLTSTTAASNRKATTSTAADSSARPDSMLIEAMRAPARSPRVIETFFWHDIAIYNWHTRINILQSLSSQWQLSVAEDLVSILQRASSYGGLGVRPDRWQDSHDARIILRHAPWGGPALIAGWQWEMAVASKIFRDDFSQQAVYTRNNDFSFGGFYSRLERSFSNRLRIGGQAGYNMEHLLGRKDHGPHLNLSVTLFPTLWQNYSHTFDAEADFNELSDRRNDDLRLSYGISRQFENDTSDSLFVHFTQLRRDNYFADTTLYIDQLNRSRRALENRLHYRMGNTWRLYVLTELGESRVGGFRRLAENSFDSPLGNAGSQNASEFHHTDFDVRHHAKLYWENQTLRNEWTLHFFSQTINYSEEAAASPLLRRFPGSGYDSKDWFLTFEHRLRWQLNSRNTLIWYGNAMRYTHETGNRNNPDNFDRLTLQANLLHQHRFSPAFLMQWEVNAYLEHHVYLKATHSAGNNWRRVFKLQPSLVFNLAPGLQFKQGFGILAQYIVYDFPEPLSRGQNSVFRNFFITDSLALRLSRQTQCLVQYQLRLEERGLLDWAQWQQRPWFDRNEHWLSVIFDHRPSAFWHFAPGVTYLRQKDWGYRLQPSEGFQRYPNGGQMILSPTVSLSYIRSPQAVIVFSAWRQLVFRDQGESSSIDHIRLTVQWSI